MSNYDLIADEYFSDRHRTCRNFDAVTKKQNLELSSTWPIIEFCAGTGRCYEYTGRFAQVHVDSSIEMLKLQPREPGLRVHCDARKTPFVDDEFTAAVAFLCDPVLDQAFIDEVYRVLAPRGRLLLSTPSYEWGTALRGGERHETTFVKADGQKVTVPSNLWRDAELKDLFSRFTDVYIWHATLPRQCEPSDAVIRAATNAGKTPHMLPLVTFVSAIKP